MSSIENIKNSVILPIQSDKVTENLKKNEEILKDLPTVLDKQILQDLLDGKYDISLKEYSDMNSYRVQMNAIYGDNSANKFSTMLNNYLGFGKDNKITAKDFVNNLKNLGVSSQDAVRTYNAMKSYSVMTSLTENNVNNFVSAKI